MANNALKMLTKLIVIVIVIFETVSADIVTTWKCDDVVDTDCTIHEVRVNPCVKNYIDGGPRGPICELLHNNIYNIHTDGFNKDPDAPEMNNTISVDYTPNFPITNITVAMYFQTYAHPNFPPLEAFDTTKCMTGTWPVDNYDINTINVEWANFPPEFIYAGRSNFKIRMWNEDDKTKQCCFIFMVRHTSYTVYYANRNYH